MTNSIVGKSKDSKESVQLIKGIGDIGVAIQRIASQLENHEDRLSNVEDTMRVNGIQEKKLTELVNRVVLMSLHGKQSNAYKNKSIRGKSYSELNNKIKNKYGIPRRGELPAKDYDSAMQFIENWTPDYELRIEIEQSNKQLELMQK